MIKISQANKSRLRNFPNSVPVHDFDIDDHKIIFTSLFKVNLKQADRVFVRLCPNSSEDYKTHSFDIVRNEEGKKVKRPKLKNQIYTGKCSFFSGALVTLNGMDRTEEL